MKKLVTILLVSLFLFSHYEIKELLKLPLLVEHFVTHKQENSNMTFFAFLAMHYGKEQKKDKDYKEDMKLPFKSLENNTPHTVIAIPAIVFSFSIDGNSENQHNKNLFFYQENNSYQSYSAHFRPPILV